ncbi:hypothetical protein [Leucobacter exalbidus]|nr:hypothetical protein [Leucobacter exalbidus]
MDDSMNDQTPPSGSAPTPRPFLTPPPPPPAASVPPAPAPAAPVPPAVDPASASPVPPAPAAFDPASYGPPVAQPGAAEETHDEGDSKKTKVVGAATLGAAAQIGVLQLGTDHASGGPQTAQAQAGQAQAGQAPAGQAPQFAGAPADLGVAGVATVKQGLLATTAAKVIAGCVAVALIGAGAVTWGAIASLGSPAGNSAEASSASDPAEGEGAAAGTTERPEKLDPQDEPKTEPEPEPKAAPAPAAEESDETPQAAAEAGPPVPEDINGVWCPAPDSELDPGCYTIDVPNVTFPSGSTYEFMRMGWDEQRGMLSFSMIDAPFGDYYPTGMPLSIPDYYPGQDHPDRDRLWSGQAGMLLLRE